MAKKIEKLSYFVKKFKQEHIYTAGKTGSGKSWKVNKILKTIIKTNYVIFDIKGEDFNELGAFKVSNFKELVKAIKSGKKKILYTNEYLSPEELNLCLEFLYKACSNIVVVVEEAHRYQSKAKILYWLQQFLKVGRSKKKLVWLISQRGQDLHNDVLTQCTHKFVGFVGKKDREYMRDELELIESGLDWHDLVEFGFFYYCDKAGEKAIQLKA
jgi:DNA helicase HerA-like ATPase